jgi:DNA-binding MarR family transcriptional regulator
MAQRRLRGRDARSPEDISFAQLRLMNGIEPGEGCRAGRLAEEAGVSPATVTGMLDNLEKRGLLVRVRSTEDRRAVVIRLTDEGRRVRDDKRAEAREVFERALSTLPAEELAAAPRLLRLLANALEAL